MRLFFYLFFCLIGVVACSKKSQPVTITPDLQQQLDAGYFLDEWHEAAGNANFNDFFRAIANDGIYVGTDKKEVWTKEEFKKFAQPYFDKGEAWNFTPIERNMYFSGDDTFIWFNETLDTWMGICRGSGVLKVTGENPNEFEIKHYVLSLTVPNEDMEKVIETIGNDTE